MSAYAFVQYADITSVVRALRKMDGEHIGANKIKVHLFASTIIILRFFPGIGTVSSRNNMKQEIEI